jgi:hypothetical protein
MNDQSQKLTIYAFFIKYKNNHLKQYWNFTQYGYIAMVVYSLILQGT